MIPTRWTRPAQVAGGVLFLLLATANAGGYRYGVSDLAFHVPAVLRVLDPATFPRDAALIDVQARLQLFDEAMAGVVRVTGASLETVFFAGYLLTVALVWVALLVIGQRLFQSAWATAALAAIVTLRHRIPRTSANSFEPYFYPRTLAFAIGLLAVGGLLHQRPWLALALAAAATVAHPTTGLWFTILVGTALVMLEPRIRVPALGLGVLAGIAGVWLVTAGPLTASATQMDDVWLAALEGKDSLFATGWPLWAWAANLALPVVLVAAHAARRARGQASAEDQALVAGGLVLVAIFLVTLPLVAGRWALPVQLQISRVFWLLDFLVALYVVAWVDGRRAAGRRIPIPAVCAALVAISLGRAVYVMGVEFRDRSLFEVGLAATPWQDAMNWLRRQPLDVHVWADSGHAFKYGSSVRVAAARDVFLEDSKDSALAMYSREIASRVAERRALMAQSGGLAALAATLSNRYGVDYIVTEETLPLTLAYGNDRFHVYATGHPTGVAHP